MCTTNVYAYLYPDGHKETVSRPSLCPSSRRNRPCANNIFLEHAPKSASYGHAFAPGPTYGGAYPASHRDQFPPTPSCSPRPSSSSYRSGDDSDRSRHSSSGDRRRRSGLYIHAQSGDFARHGDARDGRERIVLADKPPAPPTPPTPPRAYTFAPSAPPSPGFADASPRRSTSSRRPVIVHDRTPHGHDPPFIRIEMNDNHRESKQNKLAARQSSQGSHERRRSRGSVSEEEDARRRRRELEQQRAEKHRQAHEEESHESRLRARIAKANAEIASRQAVPMAPAPVLKPSSTSAVAQAAQQARRREQELLDALRRLDFREKRREEKSRLARHEEEARRCRLMQRMVPGRRATVGPGGRRSRVEHDDGVYRCHLCRHGGH